MTSILVTSNLTLADFAESMDLVVFFTYGLTITSDDGTKHLVPSLVDESDVLALVDYESAFMVQLMDFHVDFVDLLVQIAVSFILELDTILRYVLFNSFH